MNDLLWQHSYEVNKLFVIFCFSYKMSSKGWRLDGPKLNSFFSFHLCRGGGGGIAPPLCGGSVPQDGGWAAREPLEGREP